MVAQCLNGTCHFMFDQKVMFHFISLYDSFMVFQLCNKIENSNLLRETKL